MAVHTRKSNNDNYTAELVWRHLANPNMKHKKLIVRWDTPNVTSLFLPPLLRLMPPMEGFPREDLRKILHGGQRIAKAQNSKEILLKVSTPWVGRKNVTDDRWICDSKN